MASNIERRERLADLTFAMRIITKQFSEDMTVLLSRIAVDPNPATVRKAAASCAQIGQQVLRYTKYVEGATIRKRVS